MNRIRLPIPPTRGLGLANRARPHTGYGHRGHAKAASIKAQGFRTFKSTCSYNSFIHVIAMDLCIYRKHSETFFGRSNCSQSISSINPCQNPSWILGPLIATYETVHPSKMCLVPSWLGTYLGHTSGTMGCSSILQEDSLKKFVTNRGHSCPHTSKQLKQC